MAHYISIREILINRTLVPGDDVANLAKSINDTGLRSPVLVTHGNLLIDGLRRIKAYQMLGLDTIEVVVATLYAPALVHLKRAHTDAVEARPLTPRRIWELYESCRPLMGLSRSQAMKGSRNRGAGIHVGGREEFCKALGVAKAAFLQACVQLYRAAQETTARGSYAQKMANAVDNGTMTPYMAVTRLRQFERQGNLITPGEQVSALRAATSALAGIAYGFGNLGPINTDIGSQDIDDILRDLRRFRRTLQKTIHQLEKGQDSR